MSGYRKKFSGAEYPKRKTEESTKIDNLLKQIPKISGFMTSSNRFNAARTKLQESQADLSSVVQIYSSLALFLQDMRDRQFSEYEEKVKALSGVHDYDTRRKKKPEEFSQTSHG
ncbi:unnamed protein product [Brassicogethes aeneus]|uniref:Uncharacterized protein n=1 Tax=Brassicogethes aeneus TaxID=1431903 RepID=A0A9P0B292_BRAAE|nr:unnamed protein product [Brassicogethes aeneus]